MSSEGFRPSHLSLTLLSLTDRRLQALSRMADDLVELKLVKCSINGIGGGAMRSFPRLERLVVVEVHDTAGGLRHLLAACASASQVHLSKVRSEDPLGKCSFDRLVKLELRDVPVKDGGTLQTLLQTHQQSLVHLRLQALCAGDDEEFVLWRPFFSCRFPALRLLHIQSSFALLGLQPALMKRLRIVCPHLLIYINEGDPACPATVQWPLIIGTKLGRYHLTVAPRRIPHLYREYYFKLIKQ